MSDVRLNEFEKEEWWDVARAVKPEMTREQFERSWEEFVLLKAEHERARGLN